jgi:exopolyphosphatase/guanosine-5'-triphosphate,3'-diphosphate pyrophosphatase
MARALDALGAHLEAARAEGCDAVIAVGTAALRDARNADRFLAEAKRRHGLEIEVIPGEEEARLAFLAVARGREEEGLGAAGPRVVMDIGGGSTEFIRGEGRTVSAVQSLPLGSVRFTERYIHGDPVRERELSALRGAVREALSGLRAAGGEGAGMVGVAGTNTTLAAMKLALRRYDAAAIRRTRLARSDLDALIQTLAERTVARRRELPGLEPGRADVILAGAVIAREALERLGLQDMGISDRGVRHGAIYRLAERLQA